MVTSKVIVFGAGPVDIGCANSRELKRESCAVRIQKLKMSAGMQFFK